MDLFTRTSHPKQADGTVCIGLGRLLGLKIWLLGGGRSQPLAVRSPSPLAFLAGYAECTSHWPGVVPQPAVC